MSVETNLDIQCECGGSYTYVYTSYPKSAYKCVSCRHRIFIIQNKKEDIDYDSHMGYKA